MKATHDGDCQICGRRQRLPGGTLAKHGYSVDFGFFIGTCPGSHQQPFQKSIDLIAAAIAAREHEIDLLKVKAAVLRDPENPDNLSGRAWSLEYTGQLGYHWVHGTVTKVGHSSADYTFHYWEYRFNPDVPARAVFGSDAKGATKVHGVGLVETLEQVTLRLNEARAKALERQIDQIRRYIAWQRNRLVGWKPEPLIPRAK